MDRIGDPEFMGIDMVECSRAAEDRRLRRNMTSYAPRGATTSKWQVRGLHK